MCHESCLSKQMGLIYKFNVAGTMSSLSVGQTGTSAFEPQLCEANILQLRRNNDAEVMEFICLLQRASYLEAYLSRSARQEQEH